MVGLGHFHPDKQTHPSCGLLCELDRTLFGLLEVRRRGKHEVVRRAMMAMMAMMACRRQTEAGCDWPIRESSASGLLVVSSSRGPILSAP
jgi:hypothetical protein